MSRKAKDYSKTWLYYIPIGNKRYYGHSTRPLVSKYLTEHRCKYRKALRLNKITRQLHKDMHSLNMTPEQINLIFIEYYPCDNVNQATKRERYHSESYNKDLLSNQQVPSRTSKEYYLDNKDKKQKFYQENKQKLIEKQLQYYYKNKSKIIEKQNKYYYDNRDKILEQKKIYYQKKLKKIE